MKSGLPVECLTSWNKCTSSSDPSSPSGYNAITASALPLTSCLRNIVASLIDQASEILHTEACLKWSLFCKRDISKCIVFRKYSAIQISKKFVPEGPIESNLALLQIMVRRCTGSKPLTEPTMSEGHHIWVSINFICNAWYSLGLPMVSSLARIWYDKSWHISRDIMEVIWCDVLWCWCDIGYGKRYIMRYDMIWYDMICYEWNDAIRYDTIRYDMIK